MSFLNNISGIRAIKVMKKSRNFPGVLRFM